MKAPPNYWFSWVFVWVVLMVVVGCFIGGLPRVWQVIMANLVVFDGILALITMYIGYLIVHWGEEE
ncbi:hypothetical protein HQ544_05505 [Candidatus Falkowbacteria bacterium]|nr:hypothetical protein [Candidatus Falkowbacteria bacterium]